jgi:hypothetical protein
VSKNENLKKEVIIEIISKNYFMTKKKLFIVTGTLVLGIVGFFAANAHRKFATTVTTA